MVRSQYIELLFEDAYLSPRITQDVKATSKQDESTSFTCSSGMEGIYYCGPAGISASQLLGSNTAAKALMLSG